MARKKVEVAPYDPQWKEAFERIENRVLQYIGDLVLTVEHVGSTSVEGLSAKPVIDLDVVIDDFDVLPEVIKGLEKAGYVHEGNLGVEGREAFGQPGEDNLMKHHLYVCPKDGKGYLEHIAFRDYLRQNEEAKKAYGALKLSLAEKYHHDIDSYCNEKTDFVNGILAKTIYKR